MRRRTLGRDDVSTGTDPRERIRTSAESASDGRDLPTRREVLAGVGSASAALVAGCSTTLGTGPDPTLRIGTLRPPVTLDPIEAESIGSEQTVERVFEGLYAYGERTDIVPAIADGEPQYENDRREAVIELDDRARFQNGRDVVAEDVVYSFEAPLEEDAPTAWRVDPIGSVEAVDERTVRLSLSEPYPALEHALTHPIVPKEEREDDRETFATDPVGAGPYEVASFSAEKKATLRRWDDYWGEPVPEIGRVTMAYVEFPMTQLTSLRTNRNDAIEPVSPRIVDDVESVANATVKRREGYTSFYFGFNLNEGPTTDPRVREAISYCIDLEKAVGEFIEPMGERQYGPLPPRVAEEWDMPTGEWAEFANEKNAERAQQLFREADEASGQLRILTTMDPKHKELGEALAGGLRDAGHGALVVSKPESSFLERYVSGSERDYSMFVGEVSGTPDPDSFLYPTFHENAEGTTNGTFYREDAVMERLTNARETRDRERRRRLYEEAIARLLEDRVCLPICSYENSFAVDGNVSNFRVHPISQVNPRLAWENGVVTVGDGS
ncbi:ABC transporter substrate-binding protein [Halopiger xanaduensis]|uniref:ABC-type transporter, periplasmic subunit n=1 Tax=Halopiger xanaduensis (strain DSM 18323 / JCM 14033 / SH-6) TaxID=797210 RepID=F8DDN0_HALXS|nr:ABC transporter substrate-binding protein [Halopiger xanaduensis]AEH39132.1 ABC-type transporter, periplasmic subunit [Halopiger xanaduensis SH-6]